MRTRALPVFLIMLGLACSSDSNGPDTINALFILGRVNGNPPPVPVQEIGDCVISVVGGNLFLQEGGDFSMGIDITSVCTETENSEETLAVGGTYEIDGDDVTFTVAPGVTFGATRDGPRLIGTIPAGTGVLTDAVDGVFNPGDL